MIAGIDFPSFFDDDNYALRHVTGHNMHDPESMITGAEIDKGFTYRNSRRNWNSFEDYVDAVSGNWKRDDIETKAPRVFVERREMWQPTKIALIAGIAVGLGLSLISQTWKR